MIISVLQTREMRHREVKPLASGHTAGQELESRSLAFSLCALRKCPMPGFNPIQSHI